MKNLLFRIMAVIAISIAIECVVFQGPVFWKMHQLGDDANKEIHLDSFEIANWEEQGDGTLKSLYDPILVYYADGMKIDTLLIRAEASDPIPYIDIFYINEQYPNYGDRYIHIENTEDNQGSAELGDRVAELRIDLGDDPGLILSGLTVCLNPLELRFSLSRIVALVAIYWCGVFLFSLQKMPDYHLGENQLTGE